MGEVYYMLERRNKYRGRDRKVRGKGDNWEEMWEKMVEVKCGVCMGGFDLNRGNYLVFGDWMYRYRKVWRWEEKV